MSTGCTYTKYCTSIGCWFHLTHSIKADRTDPVCWYKRCQDFFSPLALPETNVWPENYFPLLKPISIHRWSWTGAEFAILIKCSAENLDYEEIFHILREASWWCWSELWFVVSNLLSGKEEIQSCNITFHLMSLESFCRSFFMSLIFISPVSDESR